VQETAADLPLPVVNDEPADDQEGLQFEDNGDDGDDLDDHDPDLDFHHHDDPYASYDQGPAHPAANHAPSEGKGKSVPAFLNKLYK